MNEVFDVLCSACKLRIFRVIAGDKDKPMVCYVSNCPECGGESFYKRVNKGRIDSDYIISDANQDGDIIKIQLEKQVS